MIIATAGHVDHGKTLLVKSLTGVDTDRWEEEKQRGLTIDLGFAYQRPADNIVLGFVDVPGHIKFINNMLAGVAGIDYALLVIATDDGVMPQTLEHTAILDLLGIAKGAVALTKVDRVDDQRVAEVARDARQLLADTSLAGAEVFPVSGLTGSGIDALADHLTAAARTIDTPGEAGHFRLAIDRCFTIKGAGVVVTGSVFSGAAAINDTLVISPQGIRVRVRGIHAQNKRTDTCTKGERCALNLVGSDVVREAVHRGNWLTAPELHAPTRRFDARVRLLRTEPRALEHWTPVHVHTGANHVTGRVALLEGRSLGPGDDGLAQLVVDEPIGVCYGDRLILRDQSASRTIAGGSVIDPFGPKRGRAKADRITRLRALETPDHGDCLAALLDASPEGLNASAFALARNLKREEVTSLLTNVPARQVTSRTKDRASVILFAEEHWGRQKEIILEALADWHKGNPAALGPSENQLHDALRPRPREGVFFGAVKQLQESRQLVKTGSTFHLPGHTASLSREEASRWRKLEAMIRAGDLRPPVLHDMAKELRVDPRDLDRNLTRLHQLGLVVRLARNRYYLPETVERLKGIAERLGDEHPEGFTASQFRDETGIGRNLAIEVLEQFDAMGYTLRIGDHRKISAAR